MRSILSLAWKEYREQRWLLIAALAIFCGFPLVEAAGRYFQPPMIYTASGAVRAEPEFYSDSAAEIVTGLGGMLAIFLAIGSTTRDLRDEVHVFWRSRPIGVGAWLMVKFVAGLAILLTACTLPMLLLFWMVADTGHSWKIVQVATTIGIHSFTVILIFSIAFLLGCLVRHATHAALLSLAAALLVYFLPVLVTPLSSLSVFNLINDEVFMLERNVKSTPATWTFFLPGPARWRVIIEPARWSPFVASMLAGSLAALILAWIAVRRDWRLPADRRAMHWSLGSVAILLFGASAFQVGSNLKVEQQFDFPAPNFVIGNLAFDGGHGVALLRETSPEGRWIEHPTVKLCSIDATPTGLRFGPLVDPGRKMNVPLPWQPEVLFWMPERPDRAYLLAQLTDTKENNGELHVVLRYRSLLTFDLSGSSPNAIVHRLDIDSELIPLQTGVSGHRVGDTIYLDGDDRTVEISLARADEPVVRQIHIDRSNQAVAPLAPGIWARQQVFPRFQHLREQTDSSGRVSIDVYLTQVGHLTPRQLLQSTLALAESNERHTFCGDLLVRADREGISTYRLVSLDSTKAHFRLLGRCAFLPLERLMGSQMVQLTVVDHRLYARGRGLTVYDLSDPANPRRAGHFATGSRTGAEIAALPGGRVLVAAERAYILVPPKAQR